MELEKIVWIKERLQGPHTETVKTERCRFGPPTLETPFYSP